jgi:hypothetical protein
MQPTLKINDLPDSEELDRVARTALRGGAGDQNNTSSSSISQVMNATTVVGNDSIFNGTTDFVVNSINTQSASNVTRQVNVTALLLDHPSLAHLDLDHLLGD